MARSVRALLGIDLSQYSRPRSGAASTVLPAQRDCPTRTPWSPRSSTTPSCARRSWDMLTINVSEFFRNVEAWDALVAQFLRPMLLAQLSVRIWSAGCSLGYEPFTLAMLAREIAPHTPVKIMARTWTTRSLASSNGQLHRGPDGRGVALAASSLLRNVGSNWEAKPELQALITWKRHDLLRDPYERRTTSSAAATWSSTSPRRKVDLYKRFCDALRPGGVLFPRRHRVDPERQERRTSPGRSDLLQEALTTRRARCRSDRRGVASWISSKHVEKFEVRGRGSSLI